MPIVPWIITATAAIVVYACWFRWVFNFRLKGPRRWPILGNILDVWQNENRLYEWFLDLHQVDTTRTIRMPSFDCISITDPADIEYVLKTNFSNYNKGQTFHEIMKDLLGEGIFNVDGEIWKRQRKIASYEFSSKRLRDYSSQNFKENAVKLCRILDEASNHKRPVEMQDLLMRLTFDSICKLGFGAEMGTLQAHLPSNEFFLSFDAVTYRVSERFRKPLWKLERALGLGSEPVLKTRLNYVDKFVYELVETRKVEMEKSTEWDTKPDLLSRFMAAIKDYPLTSNPTKDLRDVVLNFLLAGRDTTATALAWCLYAISCHPQVEEKILRELTTLEAEMEAETEEKSEESINLPEDEFSRFARRINYEMLNKMHYLQATITESLRIYGPVPTDIKSPEIQDVLPSGTEVKKGDFVFWSPWVMGRLERLWGSDARIFKPERWLKDGVFEQESPFKFVAFNAGPRLCLGKDSSYLQMKLTTAVLLRFFTFQVVPGHTVTYLPSVNLYMRYGLQLQVERR